MGYYVLTAADHFRIFGMDAATPDASPAGILDREQANDRQRTAWMVAAQAGDRAAYDALLRDCVGLIRAIARRQGVTGDGVEDVVQETLLTIHRVRHTYDPSRSFTAWLKAIAARRAIDALRKQGRRGVREVFAPEQYENYSDPLPDPLAEIETAGGNEVLKRAIAELPEAQRQAVEELALKERTLNEAALATGRSAGALKVNLHRGLKTLRVLMKGEE